MTLADHIHADQERINFNTSIKEVLPNIENKTPGSEKKRRSRSIPKDIKQNDWNKLLKFIKRKDKKFLIAILLAYGSGLRISEVVRCKPEHFRENSIFIPESKYGVERVVPIPKGWRKEFIKFLPLEFKNEKSAIRSLQNKFSIYRKKSGLNPIYTFHSLRHGFATRLLEHGVPLNQVQLALGHSNISTTSIYLKASPEDLLKSYEEKF